jgi:hypothetical protein
MAVKQASKVAGIQKKFMYIHFTYATICSKMDRYYHAQRPLGHQNIELCPNPIFMWFYLPDSINSLAISTQNSRTPCLKRHGKRCNNLAKPKKFRQE